MRASPCIQPTKVTFPNHFTSMSGNLFVPPNLERGKKYSAMVVAHPFGGVKEQTAGIYAGDDEAAVGKAVAKLEEFFGRALRTA